MIVRESVSHWQLQHRNIVRFLGVWQTADYSHDAPAMVLERAKYPKAADYLGVTPEPTNFEEINKLLHIVRTHCPVTRPFARF